MAEQDMTEQMEKIAQMAMPGLQHDVLKRHEGVWNVELKTWMSPNDPPMVALGESRIRMILGGRIFTEEFRCDLMGKPYEGFGMIGYNNHREMYWHTWSDNMSTGFYHGEGPGSQDGKVVAMVGHSERPAHPRKEVEMKGVYHFINDDYHTFETYDIGPDGDIKTMEIHYRRKK